MIRNHPKHVKPQLLDAYISGEKVQEIAVRLGVHRSYVSHVANAAGLRRHAYRGRNVTIRSQQKQFLTASLDTRPGNHE